MNQELGKQNPMITEIEGDWAAQPLKVFLGLLKYNTYNIKANVKWLIILTL